MVKRFSPYFLEAVLVAAIFLVGLAYFGSFYKENEKKFSFYQKYFFAAVNVHCIKEPDTREYNSPYTQEREERIDLAGISCSDLAKSPKVEKSYFNGWHDTHPLLSTLIGYNWRLGNFTWEALWPIVGSIAALAVLSFYFILRCFGLPWYAALLLFPATIPFGLFEQNFLYLRDFSKVPFILMAFALLGILFRPSLTYGARLSVLAASTCMVAIGMGFRQDSLVLIPAIVVGAAITSSLGTRRGALRFAADIAVVCLSFMLAGLAISLLKTTQVAQLQGYPHFIVQGFSDDFWKAANGRIFGLSFLPLYSDMIAWAAVDANSSEKIQYFASMDPKYTTSGIDLVVKYSGLALADMVTRVFSGLSVIAYHYWAIDAVGTWLMLLMGLVVAGRWRLGFFLMFTVMSLAAAGSIQFSPRHILHLIMLDRVMLVIIVANLLAAAWRYAESGLELRWALALGASAVGAVLLVVLVTSAHFVQVASLRKATADFGALQWFPSQEAYSKQFPNRPEAVLKLMIDPGKCPAGKLEATVETEGQKLSHPLDRLDGGVRPVYFAVFDPAIAKVSVDVTPSECVIERAWGPLGDGSLPPLQFFDPAVALKNQNLARHLGNILSSIF